MLGVSQSSLLRYMKNGSIPYVKIGRRTLIPKEAIDSLVKKSFENCVIEYPKRDVQID
jgi:excisionase family DNA binding protein